MSILNIVEDGEYLNTKQSEDGNMLSLNRVEDGAYVIVKQDGRHGNFPHETEWKTGEHVHVKQSGRQEIFWKTGAGV